MRTRLLACLLAALVLTAGCTGASTAPGPPGSPGTPGPAMRKGPYLMLTGDPTSMTVLWQAQPGLQPEALIEWGSFPGVYDLSARVQETGSDANGHQFGHTIAGLQPGARVHYRVSLFEAGNGAPHRYDGSFAPPPPDGATSATFFAYGDTRDNPSMHDALMGHILEQADAPPGGRTFLLHTGDYVHRGLEEGYWDLDYFYASPTSSRSTYDLYSTMPIQGAVGNHECYSSGAAFQESAALFHKYWPNPRLPGGEHYWYSFDYGPVHVAVLDVYLSPFDETSEQYRWLDQDLAASQKPWKIVAMHMPAYAANTPSAPEGNYASTANIRKHLCPLFEKHAVPLVLQGHVHNYARAAIPSSTTTGGTIQYLVLGGGGGPLAAPDPAWFEVNHIAAAGAAYHFARLDVQGDQLRATILAVQDPYSPPVVLDQFTLSR